MCEGILDCSYQWLLGLVDSLGYFGIFFLMAIESSFIPFPSEAVIIPAAGLAAMGKFNLYLIVIFGVLGSIAGALVNYYLAKYLGRPLVYSLSRSKWAKFFLINEKKLTKAENYFLKYGNLSTFLGRLIPGIRQLISLPAGFVGMPIMPFIIWTALGSAIWVSILTFVGYQFGGEIEGNEMIIWIAIIVGLMLAAYFIFMRIAKARHKEEELTTEEKETTEEPKP